MSKIGLELLLFGFLPVLIAIMCGLGLLGGITRAVAFVPVYLFGPILAVAVLAMYSVGALLRAGRWLVTKVR